MNAGLWCYQQAPGSALRGRINSVGQESTGLGQCWPEALCGIPRLGHRAAGLTVVFMCPTGMDAPRYQDSACPGCITRHSELQDQEVIRRSVRASRQDSMMVNPAGLGIRYQGWQQATVDFPGDLGVQ